MISAVWIDPPLAWGWFPLTKGRLAISKLQWAFSSDHSHHSSNWLRVETLLGLQTSFYSKTSPFVPVLEKTPFIFKNKIKLYTLFVPHLDIGNWVNLVH